MLALINDVLDMAKIESGEFLLYPSRYEYKEFAGAIEAMIEPLCRRKGVEFVFDGNWPAAAVWVDKVRINQIFLNLLSNAVKFTPAGGRVEYRMPRADIRGGRVCCDYIIRDNGIGMSKEFQTRLFEPFMQENAAAGIGSRGTGLGLAISKRLVELMGGTLTVGSRVNKGSTFRVELAFPLAEDVPPGDAGSFCSGGNVPDESLPLGDLVGQRVLVVEDNELNQYVILNMLARFGVETCVAENGRDAVDRYAEDQDFDVILMDVQMPVMNGYDATRRIRESGLPRCRSVPILAMTAHAMRGDEERSFAAGMNAHLTKPIDVRELVFSLSRWGSAARRNRK